MFSLIATKVAISSGYTTEAKNCLVSVANKDNLELTNERVALLCGKGTKKDISKGLYWINKVIDNSSIDGYSSYIIGLCYENGIGKVKSMEKAMEYYQYSMSRNVDESYILRYIDDDGTEKEKYNRSLYEFYNKIDFNKSLPYIFYFQGKKGMLENILYEVNKDLINNLVKSNYKKENIYEYIEESYDHNEVSWRFAFNYFMDVYLRKCG